MTTKIPNIKQVVDKLVVVLKKEESNTNNQSTTTTKEETKDVTKKVNE